MGSPRQLVTAVTMLALCALVVTGALVGWRSLMAGTTGDNAETGSPAPGCTTEQVGAGQRLRARQVRVSVLNSGDRAGLADRIMSTLQARGFEAGLVGNAPSDVQVATVEVRSTAEETPAARLVARQFGQRTPVAQSDEDLGPGIDVLVGNGFRTLVKAPRSIKVRKPADVCVVEEESAPAGPGP